MLDQDSDSDPYCTDEDEEGHPGPSKRPRVTSSKGKRGAAQYRTKFQVGWRQKWPFAVAVKNDPHAFCCTVCNKMISCGHQGERDLSRHADTTNHKHNVEVIKQNQRLSFTSSGSQSVQEKVSKIDFI